MGGSDARTMYNCKFCIRADKIEGKGIVNMVSIGYKVRNVKNDWKEH
jgi:hypothetical protein